MPTYEYECEHCSYRFELFQSITERARERCPKCGGRLRRLIGSGGAIIFRGSGFHITDYRSEEYKKKSKEETKP
ncbi:FmdB family transcriptional regulator, partial [candidate division TA06 bacterium DG_26]